jgi:hypothetical protein
MEVMKWTGLRQVQAVRESLQWTLVGGALTSLDPAQVAEWLAKQGMPRVQGFDLSDPEPKLPSLMVSSAMNAAFDQAYGRPFGTLARFIDRPAADVDHYAEQRSGAGWQNPANFIITSAFIRLLGAEEEFKMDVLKALFYYRPSGLPLGDEADQMVLEAEADVMTEEPEIDGDRKLYKKPAVWTWLRKQAENNVERARIFKNVFQIGVIPDGYVNKQKDAWYEKRNAIAHGRSGVVMTLAEYIEVEIFVARTLTFISDQCREKMKLVV